MNKTLTNLADVFKLVFTSSVLPSPSTTPVFSFARDTFVSESKSSTFHPLLFVSILRSTSISLSTLHSVVVVQVVFVARRLRQLRRVGMTMLLTRTRSKRTTCDVCIR